MTQFISFNCDQSCLLPPDLRDWLPADDVAHFVVVAAVDRVALASFEVRSAPGGKSQYPGYAVSQRIRQRIEDVSGWGKKIGGMRRTLFHGLERVGWSFTLRVAAYNLVRLPKLMAAPASAAPGAARARYSAVAGRRKSAPPARRDARRRLSDPTRTSGWRRISAAC